MNKLNIIHNSYRPERYEPLMAELKKQEIVDYEIWPCMIRDNVVESINLSHKMIVQDAKEKQLEYVIIGEDDLMFVADGAWKYFLDKKPAVFDIYSAATFVDDQHNKNILCGFQLYIVHSCFYDKFLAVPDNVHIDTHIDSMGGNFKVCRPFACLQRSGWSSNNKAVVDYSTMVKKEDIYTGNQNQAI